VTGGVRNAGARTCRGFRSPSEAQQLDRRDLIAFLYCSSNHQRSGATSSELSASTQSLDYLGFPKLTMATADTRLAPLDTFPSYEQPCQDLPEYNAISRCGRNIDTQKMTAFLRAKFGAGTYDIHYMQNSYCVSAPRRLSDVSCTSTTLVTGD
jgi:hypothetical protein